MQKEGQTATKHPSWLTDTPYTPEDIARYNRLTHFPKDAATENDCFAAWAKELEQETLDKLRRYGLDSIPEDVQATLDNLRKAEYNCFMRRVRAKEIAPPWSVVGPANYSKHANPDRAQKTVEVGLTAYNKAKERLRLAIKCYSPNRPVSSDEPDAIERLQKKLEGSKPPRN